MTARFNNVLRDLNRLQVLRELALLDPNRETVFDRFTELATRIIGVPVSLISMVAGDHQFFKSEYGMAEPWKTERRTPLSHSFCQHVVGTGQPLIVDDARHNDELRTNLAIRDLDVIGYLGMPLRAEGRNLGSFCVIDNQPHQWTDLEIEIMRELADIMNREMDLRADAHGWGKLAEYLKSADGKYETLFASVTPGMTHQEALAAIRAFRAEYLPEA